MSRVSQKIKKSVEKLQKKMRNSWKKIIMILKKSEKMFTVIQIQETSVKNATAMLFLTL